MSEIIPDIIPDIPTSGHMLYVGNTLVPDINSGGVKTMTTIIPDNLN